MKRSLVHFITIIILMSIHVLAQNKEENPKKNGWEEVNVRGKVKSINDITYRTDERTGKIKRDKIIGEHYNIFNERGKYIEYGGGTNKTTLKYDEKGNKIVTERFNNSVLYVRTTYKYDENGIEIENKSYFPSDSSYILTNHKYDNGNKIESNYRGSDSSSNGISVFKYDDKGNEIEDKGYKPNGNITYELNFKYDNKGNEIESKAHKSGEVYSYKFICTYDEKSNKVEQDEYHGDSLIAKNIYKYNKSGNVIEEKTYNSKGSIIKNWTYEYKYDSRENWIQKILLDASHPTLITTRTIEYFD